MIMSLDTQPGSSRPASSDQTVRCAVGSATCKGVNANSRNTIIGEGNYKFLLAFSHHKDTIIDVHLNLVSKTALWRYCVSTPLHM